MYTFSIEGKTANVYKFSGPSFIFKLVWEKHLQRPIVFILIEIKILRWIYWKKQISFQLSMDLLRNYPAGYNVLPTANPHDVVNITLQMALYHIVDMNERAQTMTTNCEIITKWHDVFLMWNPGKIEPN